ncbi:MAG TPA: nuclease-related domain-containing protein [Nocardioidaceae bacterium]
MADRLEGKAAWARQRADAHVAGDAGEQRLREAVAPLLEAGWFALHNRARPHGGNIDHILIGPSGIYVLDAKAWTGPVTIDGAVIRSNGRNYSASLRGVADQAAEVRAAARTWGYTGEVAAGLVLTGKDPGPQEPIRVGEVTVCGVTSLRASLAMRLPVLDAAQVKDLSRRVAEAFPLMNATTAPTAATILPGEASFSEPSTAFLRTSHWLYLEEWKKAGRRRLYLTDSNGSALGWKNVVDGTIAVTAEGDEKLTRAILTAATASGLSLPREAVPRLPVDMRGGAIVSAVTRVYKTIHIARRWRKGAADRLYCTAADPTDGVYDLGYVDLVTGSVHPSHVTLPKDWATAEQRLTWMLRRRPTRG